MRPLTIRGRRQRSEAAPGSRFGDVTEPLFCTLPFVEVCIMPKGEVYPNCCPDWVEFPLGNLLEQSWDDIWNGPAARRFRKSMLRGDVRHCDAHWCPHIQSALRGEEDSRVRPRGRGAVRDPVHHVVLDSPRVVHGPMRVGMHYDWSCNLACPSCRNGVEMVRGAEAERMARLHHAVETQVLPTTRAINLTGTGDPFASQFLREFLVGFDRERFPVMENVHLHTNAIMWTPAMWERMPGLHGIDVSTDVSIDAARPGTYAWVRQPGDWNRLIRNLEFITTIPNLSTLGISMTVSRPNHAELEEFLDLGESLAARCPEKYFFVEFKRVRRREHHTDESWRQLDLEQLGPAELDVLEDQLARVDARRTSPATTVNVRSNLDEFLDLGRAGAR